MLIKSVLLALEKDGVQECFSSFTELPLLSFLVGFKIWGSCFLNLPVVVPFSHFDQGLFPLLSLVSGLLSLDSISSSFSPVQMLVLTHFLKHS